jgi:hypothetical protein
MGHGFRRAVLRFSSFALVLAMLLVAAPFAVAAEPGDEPTAPIAASVGTATYDSTPMTENAADPDACAEPEFPGPFSNTMWFSYTPARDALTLIDVNSFVSADGSTDFLAIVFVYAQTDGGLDLVACGAFPATVTIPAEAGTTYLIMVGGLSASAVPDEDPNLLDRGGTFDLTIAPIKGRILRDQFHETDTFVDEDLTEECGDGDVVVSFDDRGIATTFFDASGPVAFTFHISGSTTFQMGDGPVVKISYHQTFHDYFDGTVSQIGIPVKVTVDGQVFLLDAGTVVFGPDGEILFEAGPHPVLHEGFDLCALLAG